MYMFEDVHLSPSEKNYSSWLNIRSFQDSNCFSLKTQVTYLCVAETPHSHRQAHLQAEVSQDGRILMHEAPDDEEWEGNSSVTV